jgi:hypothetical protein
LTTSTLVSLTPDWIDDFGHFGPFERRIHAVAEAAGYRHIALAGTRLQPSADWQLPAFSEDTYSAGNGLEIVEGRFDRELRAALDFCRLGPGSVVFFYTADVWHLEAILAVATDHPGVRFVVNLMRSHGWIAKALENDPDPSINALVVRLISCLIAASGTNVDVAVDTPALADDVELLTGHAVLLWPMIALSEPSSPDVDRVRADGAIHIVAPVHAQNAKGFPDLAALAERVTGALGRGELRLTARSPAGSGVHPDILRLAERFEEHGGQLVTPNMTDEGFAELIGSADVALIPYRVRPFRTRTSGVTIDALLAGKPVVAVRGTWAGDLVDRYGGGLTYTQGNVDDMEAALSGVISRLGAYRQRLGEMRAIIEGEHAPDRLIEFLGGRPVQAAREPEAHADSATSNASAGWTRPG